VLVATLIVFVAVSSVVWSMTIGSVSVTAPEVKVGDCFTELPDAAQGVPVPRSISCQESHAGEVVAVLTMPDGDFPGQPAIDAYAEDKCVAALADYSPPAMLDDSIQLFGRYPTVESWAQGDRGVLCVATLRPPRTGSIKG
jgi:putative regulator of septum formation